jgi:hypothetical protein
MSRNGWHGRPQRQPKIFMQGEKRKSHRQPLRYPARLDFGDGSEPSACLLSDISAIGARVLVEHPDTVPDTLELLLAQKNNAVRHCRVVWREGPQLGLEFVRKVAPQAAPARGRR